MPSLGRTFRTLGLGTALVTIAALAGGCGGGSSASPEVVAQGHAEFKKTCATCHGANGEGMPRLGKNLNANEFVQSSSDAELLEFLKIGRPAGHPLNERGVDMPPKGGNPAISDQQLEQIVVYMRSLQ